MVAHAAAVMAEEPWAEEPRHVGHDGRLLRLVADGLFRLVGVDWRGRPLADAPPRAGMPAPAPAGDAQPDAPLLAWGPVLDQMAERVKAAAREHDRLQTCLYADEAEADPVKAAEAEGRWKAAETAFEESSDTLHHALCQAAEVPATTLAGLTFKARLADRHRIDELGEGLVADLLRLDGGGTGGDDARRIPAADVAPPAEVGLDPALAAMMAEWQALKVRIEDGPDPHDAEEERKFALQREILAHPCARLADLCAKLPLFREELDAAGPPDADVEELGDLQLAAWRGLVQDLDALSGGPGRPWGDASSRSPAVASADAALIPLAEAAIAEERAACAKLEATSNDALPGTFARSLQFLELVTATDARTPAGLAAKARVLLTHMPEVDHASTDWRCEALSLSIARDAARLAPAG